MKQAIQAIIIALTRRIVVKYQPVVIAVTGSVGKTSTRNAIAAVLAGRWRVRASSENYNNEWGVPFTILGVASPGRSVVGWLGVLARALRLLVAFDAHFPNMLVLEYGIDRPRDMATLCDLATPQISVLTAISPVHLEKFADMKQLLAEKGELLKRTRPGGLCVLSSDDDKVRELRNLCASPSVTFGLNDSPDAKGENIRLETRQDFSFEPSETFCELHFDAVLGADRVPLILRNMLGESQVRAALCAVFIGRHFGVSFEEIAERLSKLSPAPGRLRPVPGIKGSLLLDDTYNAAPASMQAALRVISQFTVSEAARRIAVLGDMAELGTLSASEHRLVGLRAAEAGVDLLVTVGALAAGIEAGGREAGLSEEKTIHFSDVATAGRWLDGEVRKGDILLLKGSQSMRMEKISKELMAEPLRASELLVRQYGKWLET